MRNRGFVLLLIVALAGGSLACEVSGLGGGVRGSGRVVKGEVEVGGFSGVTLATAGDLTIQVGDEAQLLIEVDDNLVEYYEVDVDGKMLTIAVRNNATLQPTKEVNFYLTVEELDTIVLAGSGTVDVQSANLQAEQFSVTLAGSGEIKMAGIRADALEAEITGSGKLEIAEGTVEEQTVVVSGSGDYDAAGVRSDVATVELSGSGSAVVWAVEELAVKNVGSGSVRYVGTPLTRVEGSGSVVVEPADQ